MTEVCVSSDFLPLLDFSNVSLALRTLSIPSSNGSDKTKMKRKSRKRVRTTAHCCARTLSPEFPFNPVVALLTPPSSVSSSSSLSKKKKSILKEVTEEETARRITHKNSDISPLRSVHFIDDDEGVKAISLTPGIEVVTLPTNPIVYLLLKTHSQPNSKAASIVLGISGLNQQQEATVKAFVDHFGCRLIINQQQDDPLSKTITHLITSEVEPFMCKLNKQVVFAIVQHHFILSFRWIEECMKANDIVGEEDFEILGDDVFGSNHQGPRLSRLAEEKSVLPSAYFLMIRGQSKHILDLTRNELGDLAWLSGGIHLGERDQFPNTIFPRECLLLIENDDVKQQSHYDHCVNQGMQLLEPTWLVETIVKQQRASSIL